MRCLCFPLLATVLALGLSSTCTLAQSDVDLIAQRRKVDLAQFPTPSQLGSIPTWLASQKSDGTWSDVDYTAGCSAQRANWPIQEHWNRVITLASAWSGLNPSAPSNYTGSSQLLTAALGGMDYWFANDFTSEDCIGQGGLSNATCPCGTPGLWNSNWFDQVILIPQLVSTACLLVQSSNLTEAQTKGCHDIPYRAYALRDSFINGLGYLTGANTINVMQNSVSLACYTANSTMLSDAIDRAMAVVTFSDEPAQDGIHRDGSFLQHNGILYNGNYGKDLLNAFIQLEGEAIGTSFAANESTRAAFATDVKGGEWMIYVDSETKQEHWDLNVIGRFIAFPTTDLQANADINFNVSKLATATADFTGADDLSDTVRRLESNGTEKLLGNKGFWASDYMASQRIPAHSVQRRDKFVVTNKMISNRSHNTEYTNGANPFGYHLGQGTLFSYVNGYEYRDIEAAWDWNLIPGTTSALGAPKLNSSYAGVTGKKSYVGVVSDGWVGTSVEDYIDPHDGNIAYRKAWFFLDDSVVVTTTNLRVNESVPGVKGRPVVTVLDNRLACAGGIWVDSKEVDASNGLAANGSTLYYCGNAYLSYDTPFSLTLSEQNRTGNWSAISTSTKGNTTVPIFSAYTGITGDSHTYAFFPASTQHRLAQELQNPTTKALEWNGTMGVAGAERLTLVFWPGSGVTASSEMRDIGWGEGQFVVTSRQPAAYLFAANVNKDGTKTIIVTFADPSQSLERLEFTLEVKQGTLQCYKVGVDCTAGKQGVSFSVKLPTGGMAGSSVSRKVILS